MLTRRSLLAGVAAGATGVGLLSNVTDAQNANREAREAVHRVRNRAQDKLLSILDFGGVADGTYSAAIKGFDGTDNTPALQAAIDEAERIGGAVHIPAGQFRLARQRLGAGDARLRLKGTRHVIAGEGRDVSILLVDEDVTDVNPRIGTTNVFASPPSPGRLRDVREYSYFTNFGMRGLWSEHPGYPGINGFHIEGFREVVFIDFKATDLRNNVSRSRHNGCWANINCYIERCSSGGLRAQDTDRVLVIGCIIREVDDNAIDFHSSDEGAAPARSTCAIVGNLIEKSEGLLMLGAKHYVVADNTFRLTQGTCIYVGGGTPPEGDTPAFGGIIANNTIIDPLERVKIRTADPHAALPIRSSALRQGAIVLAGSRSSAINTAVAPGSYSAQLDRFILPYEASSGLAKFGYFNVPNTVASHANIPAASGGAAYGFVVTNNIVMRTLPDAQRYSDWGLGPMLTKYRWQDPPVGTAHRKATGIAIFSEVRNALIADNIVFGMPGAGIYLGEHSEHLEAHGAHVAFDNVVLRGNIIQDVESGIVMVGAGRANWNLIIADNVLDIDPFHRSPSRRRGPLDGSWLPADPGLRAAGIACNNAPGGVLRGNLFKNCYRAITSTSEAWLVLDNIAECDASSPDYSERNRGIAVPGAGGKSFYHLPMVADPRSPAFGHIGTAPLVDAPTPPQDGTYMEGYLVRNNRPGSGSEPRIFGWLRLTTGDRHQVGGDWAAIKF